MKKIVILILLIFISQTANAACIQCPEMQKLIKKELKESDLKLSKDQKKEIKKLKKEMKASTKDYDKSIRRNQKVIDKILKADCPDIVKMMELKNTNAQLKKEKYKVKKTTYDMLFDVYTSEQKYVIKRVMSENSMLETKKPCEFCEKELKPKCAKCAKK